MPLTDEELTPPTPGGSAAGEDLGGNYFADVGPDVTDLQPAGATPDNPALQGAGGVGQGVTQGPVVAPQPYVDPAHAFDEPVAAPVQQPQPQQQFVDPAHAFDDVPVATYTPPAPAQNSDYGSLLPGLTKWYGGTPTISVSPQRASELVGQLNAHLGQNVPKDVLAPILAKGLVDTKATGDYFAAPVKAAMAARVTDPLGAQGAGAVKNLKTLPPFADWKPKDRFRDPIASDCSSFTAALAKQQGQTVTGNAIAQYNSLPLVLGPAAKKGVAADLSQLRPGDIVFFDNGLRNSKNTDGKASANGFINHAAYYIGNGEVVQDNGSGILRKAPLSMMTNAYRFMGASRPGGGAAYDPTMATRPSNYGREGVGVGKGVGFALPTKPQHPNPLDEPGRFSGGGGSPEPNPQLPPKNESYYQRFQRMTQPFVDAGVIDRRALAGERARDPKMSFLDRLGGVYDVIFGGEEHQTYGKVAGLVHDSIDKTIDATGANAKGGNDFLAKGALSGIYGDGFNAQKNRQVIHVLNPFEQIGLLSQLTKASSYEPPSKVPPARWKHWQAGMAATLVDSIAGAGTAEGVSRGDPGATAKLAGTLQALVFAKYGHGLTGEAIAGLLEDSANDAALKMNGFDPETGEKLGAFKSFEETTDASGKTIKTVVPESQGVRTMLNRPSTRLTPRVGGFQEVSGGVGKMVPPGLGEYDPGWFAEHLQKLFDLQDKEGLQVADKDLFKTPISEGKGKGSGLVDTTLQPAEGATDHLAAVEAALTNYHEAAKAAGVPTDVILRAKQALKGWFAAAAQSGYPLRTFAASDINPDGSVKPAIEEDKPPNQVPDLQPEKGGQKTTQQISIETPVAAAGGGVVDAGETKPAVINAKPASAKTDATERYQWMRNADGGQRFGNQSQIVPLTEPMYQKLVRPKLKDDVVSLADYQAAHPDATHIMLDRIQGTGPWKVRAVGTPEHLRTEIQPQWAKRVTDFGSDEAKAHGLTRDLSPHEVAYNAALEDFKGKPVADIEKIAVDTIHAYGDAVEAGHTQKAAELAVRHRAAIHYITNPEKPSSFDSSKTHARIDEMARAPDGEVPKPGQNGRFHIKGAHPKSGQPYEGIVEIHANPTKAELLHGGALGFTFHSTTTPSITSTGYRGGFLQDEPKSPEELKAAILKKLKEDAGEKKKLEEVDSERTGYRQPGNEKYSYNPLESNLEQYKHLIPKAEAKPSERLTQAEFVQLKSKLTRAIKSKDHKKIIQVATEALDIFEDKGYPDSWANWERAKSDAEFALSREAPDAKPPVRIETIEAPAGPAKPDVPKHEPALALEKGTWVHHAGEDWMVESVGPAVLDPKTGLPVHTIEVLEPGSKKTAAIHGVTLDEGKLRVAGSQKEIGVFKAITADEPVAEANERLAQHLYDLHRSPQDHKSVYVIGGPGSGKSTVAFGGADTDLSKYVRDIKGANLDPDGAAKFLPGRYDGPDGSVFVHSRANAVQGLWLEKALESGDNVVVQGTGWEAEKVEKAIAKFQELGYHVVVAFIDVPPETAVERVANRVIEGGHDIPLDSTIQKNHAARATYGKIRSEGTGNEHQRYDNSQHGQPAVRVVEEAIPRGPEDGRRGDGEVSEPGPDESGRGGQGVSSPAEESLLVEPHATLHVEPTETGGAPEHLGPRWEMDRGAMPGEPMGTLTGKHGTVAVIEVAKDDGSIYEAVEEGGDPLGGFSTAREAAIVGERFVDTGSTEPPAKAGKAKPPKPEIPIAKGDSKPEGNPDYYVLKPNDGWTLVKGAKPVEIPYFEDLDLFVHPRSVNAKTGRAVNGYAVSEAKSGTVIATAKTSADDAIDAATEVLERKGGRLALDSAIKRAAEGWQGPSPRYPSFAIWVKTPKGVVTNHQRFGSYRQALAAAADLGATWSEAAATPKTRAELEADALAKWGDRASYADLRERDVERGLSEERTNPSGNKPEIRVSTDPVTEAPRLTYDLNEDHYTDPEKKHVVYTRDLAIGKPDRFATRAEAEAYKAEKAGPGARAPSTIEGKESDGNEAAPVRDKSEGLPSGSASENVRGAPKEWAPGKLLSGVRDGSGSPDGAVDRSAGLRSDSGDGSRLGDRGAALPAERKGLSVSGGEGPVERRPALAPGAGEPSGDQHGLSTAQADRVAEAKTASAAKLAEILAKHKKTSEPGVLHQEPEHEFAGLIRDLAAAGADAGLSSPAEIAAFVLEAVPDLTAADVEAVLGRDAQATTNYRITENDRIGDGGEGQKTKDLIAAVETLKKIESEKRLATPAEQAVLVKFPGWGWTGNLLNPKNAHPEALRHAAYERITAALTPEELSTARKATLNSHYTSPTVISSIWDAIARFGLKEGTAVEPSAGVGHFIGMGPESLTWEAVELDSLTGRILGQLYPEAKAHVMGFQEAKVGAGNDLVISNVPFLAREVRDPGFLAEVKNPALLARLHNYFIAKGLHLTRPGGIAAFITSQGTLDAIDAVGVSLRAHIASQADLLGAIRLPNNAFKKNAITEVTTDILFFRKRVEGEMVGGQPFQDVLSITTPDGPAHVNEYFVAHPEMALGTHSLQGRLRGSEKEYGLLAHPGQDLGEQLAAAVATLPKDIYSADPEAERKQAEIAAKKEGTAKPPEGSRYGSLYTQGGKAYVVNRFGAGEELERTPAEVKAIGDFGTLRDLANGHIKAMLAGVEDADLKASQIALKAGYDAFVKAHGPLNGKYRKLFLQDPDAYTVLTLEVWQPKTKTETARVLKLADIFEKRTIQQTPVADSADSALDALTLSIRSKGKPDLDEMARLTGLSHDELLKDLKGHLFNDPDLDKWVTAAEYGSGNVRKKYKAAIAIGDEDSIKFLEARLPTKLEPQDITANPGSTWVPGHYYGEFLQHLVDGRTADRPKALYSPLSASWKLQYEKSSATWRSTKALDQWGAAGLNPVQLFEKLMNSQYPNVTMVNPKGEGRVTDPVATALAKSKLEEIRSAWHEWVMADEDRAADLAAIYNEEVNAYAPRVFDGEILRDNLPGLNPAFKPWGHQLNFVVRAIQMPASLAAHDVGTGKTSTMAISAMELRRTGTRIKPMLILKKATLEQIASDFKSMYPAARILVASSNNFTPENRRDFMGQIATGDWDSILLSHDSFTKLTMSPAAITKFYGDQIKELEAFLYSERKGGADDDDYTVKQVEAMLVSLETRLEKIQEKLAKRQDSDASYWENLGVDHLFVDEAHYFKNLMFHSALKGMGNAGSQRALDLLMKVGHLRKTGGGLTFLTGTPISNSVAEMHTLLRYLNPDGLAEQGMSHFDAWQRTFAAEVTNVEKDSALRYRIKTRLASFHNVPELKMLYNEVADVVRAKDVPEIRRPNLTDREGNVTGKPIVIAIPSSVAQKAYYQTLVKRADDPRNKFTGEKVTGYVRRKGDDNMLAIGTDGRKASLDLRLVDETAFDDPQSKVNQIVGQVHDVWKNPVIAAKKGTQIVFLDFGTPGGAQFDLYSDIRDKLVARGMPREQIAFIHEAKTDADLPELFKKMNSGEVRVMLASTDKGGVGVNVQERLKAIHHADPKYRPSDVDQRNGRMVRAGNTWTPALDAPEPEDLLDANVMLFHYVVTESYDEFMWHKNATKQAFVDQIMHDSDGARSIEDLDDEPTFSYAEMVAIASGDPRMRTYMKGSARLAELQMMEASHIRLRQTQTGKLASYENFIPEQKAVIKDLQTAIGERDRQMPDEFAMTVKGKKFTPEKFTAPEKDEKGAAIPFEERSKVQNAGETAALATAKREAGLAILDQAAKVGENTQRSIGTYGPFTLEVQGATSNSYVNLVAKETRSGLFVHVGLSSALNNIAKAAEDGTSGIAEKIAVRLIGELDDSISNFDSRLDKAETDLGTMISERKQIHDEVMKPFKSKDELVALEAEMKQLAVDLGFGGKEGDAGNWANPTEVEQVGGVLGEVKDIKKARKLTVDAIQAYIQEEGKLQWFDEDGEVHELLQTGIRIKGGYAEVSIGGEWSPLSDEDLGELADQTGKVDFTAWKNEEYSGDDDELEQAEELSQGPKGTYNLRTGVTKFMPGKADVSTLFHEPIHGFEEFLRGHDEYGPIIRKYYGEVQNKKGSESLARHYEGWLMDPADKNVPFEMVPVFRAIVRWMGDVYGSMRYQGKTGLDAFNAKYGVAPDEVKAVFERVASMPRDDLDVKLQKEFDDWAAANSSNDSSVESEPVGYSSTEKTSPPGEVPSKSKTSDEPVEAPPPTSEGLSTSGGGNSAGTAKPPSEKPVTGARKSITEAENAALGGPEVVLQHYQVPKEAYEAGKAAVELPVGDPKRIDPIALASDVANRPRQLMPTEIGALAFDRARMLSAHAAYYGRDIIDAALAGDRAGLLVHRDTLEALLHTNYEALRKGGRENSAALQAMKMAVAKDYSYQAVRTDFMGYSGGKAPAEKADIAIDAWATKDAEYQAQIKKLEAEMTKLRADQVVRGKSGEGNSAGTAKSPGTKAAGVAYNSHKDIDEAINRFRKEQLARTAKDNAVLHQDPEGEDIRLIKDLSTIGYKTGVATLSEMLSFIKRTVADVVPSLDDELITEVLAGKYNLPGEPPGEEAVNKSDVTRTAKAKLSAKEAGEKTAAYEQAVKDLAAAKRTRDRSKISNAQDAFEVARLEMEPIEKRIAIKSRELEDAQDQSKIARRKLDMLRVDGRPKNWASRIIHLEREGVISSPGVFIKIPGAYLANSIVHTITDPTLGLLAGQLRVKGSSLASISGNEGNWSVQSAIHGLPYSNVRRGWSRAVMAIRDGIDPNQAIANPTGVGHRLGGVTRWHVGASQPQMAAEYEKHIALRTSVMIRAGKDPTLPDNANQIRFGAANDAAIEAFRGKDSLSSWVDRPLMRAIDAPRAETGKPSVEGKRVAAFVVKTFLPVVKLAANIAHQSLQYTGEGAVEAAAKVIHANYFKDSPITPEQADNIVRTAVRGGIGLVFAALVLLFPDEIRDLLAFIDGLAIHGVPIGKLLDHHPAFEALRIQLSAHDAYQPHVDGKGKLHGGIDDATKAALGEWGWGVPGVQPAQQLGDLLLGRSSPSKWAGGYVSNFIPGVGALRWTAGVMDQGPNGPMPRKKEDGIDELKASIPIARGTLPPDLPGIKKQAAGR